MEKIIRLLFDYIDDSNKIPDELLYEFMKRTMQIVQRKATEEIPEEFWDFEHYVGMYWRGNKYDYATEPYMVYQMGQLLTCTNMLNILVNEKNKEISLEEYADLNLDKFRFFEEIYKKRGITHKDLAEKVEMSPSALSQFVNRIKNQSFFTYRVMGREKHYYLTEYGENLYSIMDQKKRKATEYTNLRTLVNSNYSSQLSQLMLIQLKQILSCQYSDLELSWKEIDINNQYINKTDYVKPLINEDNIYRINSEKKESIWERIKLRSQSKISEIC